MDKGANASKNIETHKLCVMSGSKSIFVFNYRFAQSMSYN